MEIPGLGSTIELIIVIIQLPIEVPKIETTQLLGKYTIIGTTIDT